MNGFPAVLLAFSSVLAVAGAAFYGKKKTLIQLAGVSLALVACTAAALEDKKRGAAARQNA